MTTNATPELAQTPATTAADVRALLEALRAEYKKLPPAARLQIREALQKLARAAAERAETQELESEINNTMIGFGGLKFFKLLAHGNG